MTEEFVSAAELMVRVLGAEGHEFVVIPHPISSATGDQLAAAARVAADAIAAVIAPSVGDGSVGRAVRSEDGEAERSR